MKVTKEEAVEAVSGYIDTWAASINKQELDDLRQEMYLAIVEAKKDTATLAYFKSRMHDRAIDYLRREFRVHEREVSCLADLLSLNATISLGSRRKLIGERRRG
jgi:DNA-directed RNA polymerase specialized sigma24 family protein